MLIYKVCVDNPLFSISATCKGTAKYHTKIRYLSRVKQYIINIWDQRLQEYIKSRRHTHSFVFKLTAARYKWNSSNGICSNTSEYPLAFSIS